MIVSSFTSSSSSKLSADGVCEKRTIHESSIRDSLSRLEREFDWMSALEDLSLSVCGVSRELPGPGVLPRGGSALKDLPRWTCSVLRNACY